MAEVKLFGTLPSPLSWRIQWALKLKGVEYEYVEEDLMNKSPLLLKYNPVHKKIPVLLHNERPIPESLVILEYIDETWQSNPLLPKDPLERANARFWAKFVDEKCLVSVFAVFLSAGKEQEKHLEEAAAALKILEGCVHGKRFFSGEGIGYADLVAGWIPQWLPVIEEVAGVKLLDPQSLPSLCAWSKSFLQVELIKENLPPRDELIGPYDAKRKIVLASAAT
ncbi:glutathione transferase GST 23-like [Aristolochia californica]|uniref:glutathione transferase GST 23-like n=1 Tax=Aristolochia californica TaxID=171875 RepID=UPI0035D55888